MSGDGRAARAISADRERLAAALHSEMGEGHCSALDVPGLVDALMPEVDAIAIRRAALVFRTLAEAARDWGGHVSIAALIEAADNLEPDLRRALSGESRG